MKTGTNSQSTSQEEREQPQFPNRMAKKRALDKAKRAMPSSPIKKANLLLEMSRSPQTRKILVKKGAMRTAEDENEIEALKAVAQDLHEGLSTVKANKTTSGRSAFTAAKSLAFGESIKKTRSAKALSKLFSLDRRSISKSIEKRIKILKGEESCWLAKKRQTRRDALSDDTKKMVYDFWTHSVSRPTGNKNDVMRKRVEPKVSVEHPKHVLELTQTEAFQKFQTEHPEVKLKQRKFESLKPFFVKGAKERDRQSCMCRQHVEAQMVFKDCMKVRSQLSEQEGVDATVYTSLSEVISLTLCPLEGENRYHNITCLKRECNDCGVNKFDLLPQESSNEGNIVKWKRYDYLPTGKLGADGKEIKKISLVSKETPPKELFDYFYKLLESFPYHSFLAKWEREQCDQLIAHLPLDQALCIHDYSESYACRYQDEIQSQYFSMDKVSIHVTVLYRHASLEYDGVSSTVDEPEVIKEYVFAISDDVTQDHDSVLHISKLISAYLKDEVEVQITKMHEFTDGCSGQYKSRHCFGDLSCSLQHLGYVVQRNFFATSHAKGEQDAAGSHVKQKATSEVLRRNTTITNAEDLCSYLKANFSEPAASFLSRKNSIDLKRRIFFHIPASGTECIPRNRPEGSFKTLKGIRQLHSVKACSEQLKIFVRERACYCFSCLEEKYDDCENQQWVDQWRELQVQREPSAALTRSREDAGDIEHSVQLADLADKGTIVAVAADDDRHYDYYLLKVVSDGGVTLESNYEDEYGSVFSRGQRVLLGHFFLRENLIDFTFKLETTKQAAVLTGTVRHICRDLVLKSAETRRRKAIYKLPITEHEEIMASL